LAFLKLRETDTGNEQPGTRAAYLTEFYNAHTVYDKYAKHGGGGEGSRCADGVYLGSLVCLYFESACSLAAMALCMRKQKKMKKSARAATQPARRNKEK
jgi:hypothetical protein